MPKSSSEWKAKYVVVGGIIAKPYMMNMYCSKSDYDTAVIETQARKVVSVKVKQFDLQGAEIQDDWQAPQMHQYRNKIHPTRYFVIIPSDGNPIKIGSPYTTQLRPVFEGVRRVIYSQRQRQPRVLPLAQQPNNTAPLFQERESIQNNNRRVQQPYDLEYNSRSRDIAVSPSRLPPPSGRRYFSSEEKKTSVNGFEEFD